MDGWNQGITEVEFNCKAATQSVTSRYTGNCERRTCSRSIHVRGGYRLL